MQALIEAIDEIAATMATEEIAAATVSNDITELIIRHTLIEAIDKIVASIFDKEVEIANLIENYAIIITDYTQNMMTEYEICEALHPLQEWIWPLDTWGSGLPDSIFSETFLKLKDNPRNPQQDAATIFAHLREGAWSAYSLRRFGNLLASKYKPAPIAEDDVCSEQKRKRKRYSAETEELELAKDLESMRVRHSA